ncbi:MFS transporter [Mesorhizobium sp. AR02]|uniref:MFS transporter n=1 Tax=Mesorhizobium sp. AR02 TaxID=2865837 RepID=UPI00215DE235|nr:MFS transporter [Mesorhizobium sp. AR02]UVK54566.1 MFS transporter [Mesorhizobium sp. AR02]
MVPFAKSRLGIDDGQLGILLLFLGGGSLVGMPLTGLLTARFGYRLIIICGTLVAAAVLPILAAGMSVLGMAVALAVFGAAIGAIDVAMNVQAVIVQKRMGLSLMSGFHACYSIGGTIGAGGLSALLKLGASPLQACLALGILMFVAVSSRAMGFIPLANDGGKTTPLFVVPRPLVLFIGLFSALVFMAEGAVLDWSGVFLLQYRGAEPYAAGSGYAAFAVAITGGRLIGDRLVDAVGGRRVLLGGGLISAIGFVVVLALPSQLFALCGFMLVGFGAANIIPLMFKAAGVQTSMPANLAVATVTTLAYGGHMLGPAFIGLVAHFLDLRVAFAMLATTMVFVAFAGRAVLADSSRGGQEAVNQL